MTNLKILETAEDRELQDKKRLVRETLENWLQMTDIDELLILGRVSKDTQTEFPLGLRSNVPRRDYGRIWWLGALESAKHQLGAELEEDREDYMGPEEEGE